MLINIVNRDTNTHFTQIFKESLILPEKSKITLKKAIIKLEPKVTVNTANDNFRFNINGDSSGVFTTVFLDHGVYTKKDFLLHVVEKINEKLGNGQENFQCKLDYFNGNTTEPNCYTISIKCNTLSPSINQIANFENDNLDLVSVYINTHTTAGTLYYNYIADPVANFIGLEGQGASCWANASFINAPIERTWFDKTSVVSAENPNNNTTKFGLITWTVNVNTLNYIIGFSDGNLDLTGVGSTGIGEYTNIKNLSAGLYYNPTSSGVSVLESSNQKSGNANLSSIKTFTATEYPNLMDVDTEFCIMLPNDAEASPKYFYKPSAQTYWTELSLLNDINPPKRCVMDQHSHYPVFAFYDNATSSADIHLPVANFSYSVKSGSSVKNTDNYGQFIKFDFDEVQQELGLAERFYTAETYGDELAELKITNSLALGTTDPEEPYLNLNITNLPIKSYCNNDTTDLDAGVSQVKTLASIPRYNKEGVLNSNNLVYDDNTQTLELNNAGEMILNELHFDLRNSSGNIPDDIGSMKSLVLSITH